MLERADHEVRAAVDAAEALTALMEAGMNGFASKPITSARLHAEMEKVMGQTEEYDTPVLDQGQLAQLASELGMETVTELIGMFLEDSAAQMEAIRANDGDAGLVLREVHTLTGAARNVGLQRLGDASAALEQALRGGMVTDLAERIDAMERLHIQAIACLQSWTPEHAAMRQVPA